LTIENTDLDLKVHALHYANELLVRVRLSFQKLLQNRSTYRNDVKKMFGKRVTTRTRCRQEYRARYTIDFDFYVLLFFTTISMSKKMFSFSARAEKSIALQFCATHWREWRGWDLVILSRSRSCFYFHLVIFDWFALNMRMQVILDSSSFSTPELFSFASSRAVKKAKGLGSRMDSSFARPG